MTPEERKILYIYEYLFNRDAELEHQYKDELIRCIYTRNAEPRQLFYAVMAIIRYQEFCRVQSDLFRILRLWDGSGGFLK